MACSSIAGENPLYERIERRLAAMVRWPYENGEGLQVLRYRQRCAVCAALRLLRPCAARHATHPATWRAARRHHRDVSAYAGRGGATIFPDVGLEVAPIKGFSVFFSYDRPHPDTDVGSAAKS